jgi:hypothetical protein
MNPKMMSILQRHALPAVILAASCVVIYVVGFFYQQFIDSPADLAALVFIVAIYTGAVYNQVKGAGGK